MTSSPSPSIWTSIWRARSTSFSMNKPPSPNAASASARRCGIVHPSVAARNHRYAGGNRRAPRRDFVAHQANGARRRPNENQASLLDGIGEVGILREETVARVNRVGATAGGRRYDRGNVEVRLG